MGAPKAIKVIMELALIGDLCHVVVPFFPVGICFV